MNWLLKIAGRDDYLAGLGASPDIIQYVMQLDDAEYAHFLTNEFRTNPQMSLNDLQSLQMSVKETPYLETEERHVDKLFTRWPPERANLATAFRQWCLVELRKHRANSSPERPFYDVQGLANLPTPTSLPNVVEFILQRIKDWYISQAPEIASYSLPTALESTMQWEQASRGEGGEVYDGTDKIVHSWTEGPFAGWSIKKILSQNNAIVEGDIMSHCVGDCEYDDGFDVPTTNGPQVQMLDEGINAAPQQSYEAAGIFRDPYMGAQVELYSLRDPKDKPHVTIELGAETWVGEGGDTQAVYQVYGPGNSEPKMEYKHLIGEWFGEHEKSEGHRLTWGDDDSVDVNALKHEDPRSLPDKANELFYEGDSYGIMPNLTGTDIEYLYDTIMEVVTYNNRSYEVGGGDLSCAEWLINFAWDADKQWMQENCGMDEKQFSKGSRIVWLEMKTDENNMGFWDHYEPHEPMPDEDDFETPEEYQEAYKEWEDNDAEIQDWHMNRYLPYAFDNHMMSTLYQELHKKDSTYKEIKSKCVKPEEKKPPIDSAEPATYNAV